MSVISGTVHHWRGMRREDGLQLDMVSAFNDSEDVLTSKVSGGTC